MSMLSQSTLFYLPFVSDLFELSILLFIFDIEVFAKEVCSVGVYLLVFLLSAKEEEIVLMVDLLSLFFYHCLVVGKIELKAYLLDELDYCWSEFLRS